MRLSFNTVFFAVASAAVFAGSVVAAPAGRIASVSKSQNANGGNSGSDGSSGSSTDAGDVVETDFDNVMGTLLVLQSTMLSTASLLGAAYDAFDDDPNDADVVAAINAVLVAAEYISGNASSLVSDVATLSTDFTNLSQGDNSTQSSGSSSQGGSDSGNDGNNGGDNGNNGGDDGNGDGNDTLDVFQ